MAFKEGLLRLNVHLHPSYIGNIKAGVEEQLNQMLLKYTEEMDGVLLSYWDLKYRNRHARIINETPYLHFHIQTQVLTFAPTPGLRLVGTINKAGSHHLGLLVYKVFNASIDAEHIKSDFKFDETTDSWRNKKTGETLKLGQEVRFEVTKVHRSEGLLSISGSLMSKDAGPVSAGGQHTSEIAAPDSVTKKRKRSIDISQNTIPIDTPAKKTKKHKKEEEEAEEEAVPIDIEDTTSAKKKHKKSKKSSGK
eukprot:GILK01007963.1.p1 GENE.GILK01007963.1~~GILK01007963.1.p1  ORF type:complete len:250 (+),score=53.32 GILK01007963.1:41-790(+)